MRSRRPACRRCFLASAAVAILMTVCAVPAVAGEFAVANCAADPLNFSTRAFEDFATRGMRIRRACDPEGPGLRGLIVGNVVRKARVERGSVALATIDAPSGTRFTTFRWAGSLRRSDCRYALQLWAEAPDIRSIPMKNVRANQNCPPPKYRQLAAYRSETFNVQGATRIVQRVVCVGGDGRKSCSSHGSNYVRTFEAEVGIADVVAPTASILGDTPLARGEWVSGMQPLNYDASDNVGVRMAYATSHGMTGGFEERPCAFAAPEHTFADKVPCPNGPGHIGVDTTALSEGTQALVVRAQDTAGNVGDSTAVTARIDNSPPGRVDVGVDGGDGWRNRNDFEVAWANPVEPDRAPIAGAAYKLCPVGPGSCARGEQAGADIARLPVQVPAPGEWSVSLWRRDAAGNTAENTESVPVTLRYDPRPPQLGFEPPSPTDPTLVAVAVTDDVSGLAGGAIELSSSGSGVWQSLPTEQHGSRLVARIDDASLPAGGYALRAHAFDKAANEASTDRRLDGQPMALTLPLRIGSNMRAGFERVRTVRRTVRRNGKRQVVRRRSKVLAPATQVRSGGRAVVAGRLFNRDGQGIAGAEIRVLSSSAISPEQLVAVVSTDAAGRYRYSAAGNTSRTLRFVYPGSPLVLPSERAIRMTVPALTTLRVNRKRLLNGQAVTFSGRLRTHPAPPQGKLVELQVRLSDRWQTFRTSRTDAAGRWAIRYRFKRTRGVQHFRFRARLPAEASYPFATGGSRPLTVRVRGVG
jgi:hypothetical protein